MKEGTAKVLSETEPVTIEVIAVRKAPVDGKLLALVDVTITIHGIEFKVRGLRVSREILNGEHATSVTAPLHRDNGGQWKSTVTFPEQLHEPLSDIVLTPALNTVFAGWRKASLTAPISSVSAGSPAAAVVALGERPPPAGPTRRRRRSAA